MKKSDTKLFIFATRLTNRRYRCATSKMLATSKLLNVAYCRWTSGATYLSTFHSYGRKSFTSLSTENDTIYFIDLSARQPTSQTARAKSCDIYFSSVQMDEFHVMRSELVWLMQYAAMKLSALMPAGERILNQFGVHAVNRTYPIFRMYFLFPAQ